MATTIVSHVSQSKSPSVEPNGNAMDLSSNEAEHTAGDRAARTLGLMNVPDTVNDARIRSMAEQYGKLIKVVLRPDHQGAIVEYADVHAAGRASLELEGKEIAAGRKLHIGSVPDMLKQGAERKTDRIQVGKQKDKVTVMSQAAGPIKRPAQPGGRGGRRGGLGVKRGGFPSAQRSERPEGTDQAAGSAAESKSGEKTTKSNDDFRAMIQGNGQ